MFPKMTRWAVLAVAVVAMVATLAACDDNNVGGGRATPSPTTPGSPAASPTPSATPGAPTLAWRWDSGATDSWVWVTADERDVVASYGKEYQCCDNFFVGAGGVALLDAKDGHELWRFETPAHAFRAALLEDRVVFGTSDGTVYALALDDGKELWCMDFPGVPAQAVAAGHVVVIADADPETWGPNGIADKVSMAGRAWGLDPATGEVKWRAQAGGFNAFVAASDDVVVVASHSARDQDEVVALDAATGRERWRKATVPVSSPPALAGSLALVPGSKLRAFDLATGAEKWSVEPDNGGTFVFPLVSGDLIAVGTNTGPLELRALSDGKLVAAADIGDCLIQPFEAGGQLYAQACGGLLKVEQQAGGQAKIVPVFVPQGSVDSVAVSGALIVFSTGIGGPNPEMVLAVRP